MPAANVPSRRFRAVRHEDTSAALAALRQNAQDVIRQTRYRGQRAALSDNRKMQRIINDHYSQPSIREVRNAAAATHEERDQLAEDNKVLAQETSSNGAMMAQLRVKMERAEETEGLRAEMQKLRDEVLQLHARTRAAETANLERE